MYIYILYIATIPCSFPDIIQYAQIKVFDESTVKLYDYFEAAASFIDLCNPLNYDINNEANNKKRKIMVHCAMGISRSATITISYLMSRPNLLNKSEQKLLDHIQTNLEALDQKIESKINETNSNGWSPKIFEQHRMNKDWTKRVRKKYKKYQTVATTNHALPLSVNDEKDKEKEKEEEGGNGDDGNGNEDTKTEEIDNDYKSDKMCNGFTLGESYLFVLERRNVICPNVGFCRQLEMWEKYVWDYNDSTLYQIPFFRPDLDDINNEKNAKSKNGKSKNGRNRNNGDGDDNYQCNDQCCIIL